MKTVVLRLATLMVASSLLAPAASIAGGMTFHSVSPCTVVRTASAGGAFSADETRSYVVRGETEDLSGQGGEASGCGVPVGASAISINVIANAASTNGAIKAWPFNQAAPVKFMNISTVDVYNGSTIVKLGDPALASDFSVQVFRAAAHVMIVVNGYLLDSAPSVSLDGVDISSLDLQHAGGDSSNHRLVSPQGYYVDVLGGGSLRGNIIYYTSSDCTCVSPDCSGEAFVSGGQPGQIIRGTDGSDPFGANRIFYIDKAATYNVGLTGTPLDPGTGTGSRRVTSACQSNQDLSEGFPVLINDPAVTGVDTSASGDLDPTQRHFITFE